VKVISFQLKDKYNSEHFAILGFFIGLIPRLLFQNLKVIIPASVFFFASRCFLQWNGFLTVSTVMTKVVNTFVIHMTIRLYET